MTLALALSLASLSGKSRRVMRRREQNILLRLPGQSLCCPCCPATSQQSTPVMERESTLDEIGNGEEAIIEELEANEAEKKEIEAAREKNEEARKKIEAERKTIEAKSRQQKAQRKVLLDELKGAEEDANIHEEGKKRELEDLRKMAEENKMKAEEYKRKEEQYNRKAVTNRRDLERFEDLRKKRKNWFHEEDEEVEKYVLPSILLN